MMMNEALKKIASILLDNITLYRKISNTAPRRLSEGYNQDHRYGNFLKMLIQNDTLVGLGYIILSQNTAVFLAIVV